MGAKAPYLCIVKLINQQKNNAMTYNQIFQKEIAKGNDEIKAAENARLIVSQQRRNTLKGRSIYDSKNAGAISI